MEHEHVIEVFLPAASGRQYSFETPAPYPTKEDASNVMRDIAAANDQLEFRVVPYRGE